MKRIYLVRHAKSGSQASTDFERTLNTQGEQDAAMMGKLLGGKGAAPDLIISSSALRALATAKIIAEQLHYPNDKLLSEDKLYEADDEDLMEYIQALDDNINEVLICGHNPAISKLANCLSEDNSFALATCSICSVEMDADRWQDIDCAARQKVCVEFPDDHRE